MSGETHRSTTWQTAITTLQEAVPPFLPEGVRVMTVVVELPPGDPGTPPHRHSGPAFGYVVEGEMLCEPGQPMLTLVDEEELVQRADRRAPRPERRS
jgi:quercetin dioxygenase-like cupin family protein